VRRHFLLAVLSSLAFLGCINDRTPVHPLDGSVDLGAVDAATVPYDPVNGMPFTGPLLFDDARVQALDPSGLRHGTSPCHAPALVKVLRCVDGDTIHVEGLDGVGDTVVRLIGINSPEVAHPGPPPTPDECYGPEARDYMRTELSGHWVWLTFGNGPTCLDIYDRTLAYVFLGGGDRDMVNRQLLQRGYATKYIFSDNATYETLFTADDAAARAAHAGLWGVCPAP
jgi:micrococcal nuclease